MPDLLISELMTHNIKLNIAIVRLGYGTRYGVAQQPQVGKPYLPAATASSEGYAQFAQAARAFNRIIRTGHTA